MKKEITITATLSEFVEINGVKTKKITIRRPESGELRGLSMHDIAILDVDTITTILPRISDLNAAHMAKVPPCDMLKLGMSVASFLVPGE